jgi:hypothetical protein
VASDAMICSAIWWKVSYPGDADQKSGADPGIDEV